MGREGERKERKGRSEIKMERGKGVSVWLVSE